MNIAEDLKSDCRVVKAPEGLIKRDIKSSEGESKPSSPEEIE